MHGLLIVIAEVVLAESNTPSPNTTITKIAPYKTIK